MEEGEKTVKRRRERRYQNEEVEEMRVGKETT